MTRSILTFAAVAIFAAITVPRFAAPFKSAAAPTQMAPVIAAAPAVAPAPPAPAGRSVVVTAGADGHFHVSGSVNSRRTQFMVDTGASVVALSAKDADSLGIRPPEREFTAPVQTANGIARAARVTLDTVKVDDLIVRDVDAIVLPDAALRDNLLGLSFLKRLRHFEYGNGKLVLEN